MKREYPDILNCQAEGKDGEVGVQDQCGHRCFFIPDSYLYGIKVTSRVKTFF
jgi:hypothetical protein